MNYNPFAKDDLGKYRNRTLLDLKRSMKMAKIQSLDEIHKAYVDAITNNNGDAFTQEERIADVKVALTRREERQVLQAQINKAKEIRDNIQNLGSEVYFAVQRIEGNIVVMNRQLKALDGEENND